jgi:hypothetical protein
VNDRNLLNPELSPNMEKWIKEHYFLFESYKEVRWKELYVFEIQYDEWVKDFVKELKKEYPEALFANTRNFVMVYIGK